MTVRRIAMVVLVVSGTASTAYLFTYLARWEWQRATIAGLFTVLAVTGLFGTMLLERLGRLERAAHHGSEPTVGPEPAPAALGALRATRPLTSSRYFRWLDPHNTGVFIPVLLGAGVLLSGLGWVAEKVASHTAVPVAERRLAKRLAGISLPASLLGEVSPEAHHQPGASRSVMPGRSRQGDGRRLGPLALAMIALTTGLAVLLLAELTQDRPDTLVAHTSSTVEFSIDVDEQIGTSKHGADALWHTCRLTVPEHDIASPLVQLPSGAYAADVRPALGEHGKRRLLGCLGDSTIVRTLSFDATVTNHAATAP